MIPPRRILIGAASFADARAALRLARHLAVRPQTEVGGLLVEEAALSDLPRLRRQRVVTAHGTFHAVPSALEAARRRTQDANAFQAALAELTARPGPVEQRRGDLTVAVWEGAQGWDLLVCGQRETHGLRGRVVLIAPPAGAAPDAAELADHLARSAGTTALTLGLAPKGNADADEIFSAETALFARIARLNCLAVVLDRDAGPVRSVDQLRALLAVAHSPVVLVGAAGEPTAPPA